MRDTLLFFVFISSLSLSARQPQIAVVMDADLPAYHQLLEQTRQAWQARTVLKPTDEPVWDRNLLADNHFVAEKIGKALEQALQNPQIDVVLTLGPLSALQVMASNPSKPVISGFLHDPDMFGIHYNDFGRSGLTNINFVAPKGAMSRDLSVFSNLIHTDKIHLLFHQNVFKQFTGYERYSELTKGKYFIEGQSVDDLLAAIPETARAVYFGPALHLDAPTRTRLFEELASRKTAVFTDNSSRDVALGAFAGLARDTDQRLAARLAANLDAVLSGTPAADLPCYLPRNEQLIINGKIAQILDFPIDLDIRTRADIINAKAVRTGTVMSLSEAIGHALEHNIDLEMAHEDLVIAKKQEKIARAALLPRITSKTTYTENDPDRGDVGAGLSAETSTTLSLQASQNLFDDAALTRYRTGRKQHESEQNNDNSWHYCQKHRAISPL